MIEGDVQSSNELVPGITHRNPASEKKCKKKTD